MRIGIESGGFSACHILCCVREKPVQSPLFSILFVICAGCVVYKKYLCVWYRATLAVVIENFEIARETFEASFLASSVVIFSVMQILLHLTEPYFFLNKT